MRVFSGTGNAKYYRKSEPTKILFCVRDISISASAVAFMNIVIFQEAGNVCCIFTNQDNLVPRACDPREGNEGSGIIRCRKQGILAKIELRIHFNGQSDSSLKRIIPEPSFPSQGSQARGTRLRIFKPSFR
jgi:hypothetical protein